MTNFTSKSNFYFRLVLQTSKQTIILIETISF